MLSLQCPRQVAMERYLRRRDASRPDGDEALFAKRCDEFERENPAILEYYETKIEGRVLKVSRRLPWLFFLDCVYELGLRSSWNILIICVESG